MHSYKRVGEKLKTITSDVLNGNTRKHGQHKVWKSCVVESDDVKCSVDRGENNREVKPTSGSFVDSRGNNCEVKSTTASYLDTSKKRK